MTKGLFLVRTMYIGGCRVIGADFDLTKNFQCGRFSNALSRFVALKKPSKESADGYINQVLGLILDEHVDLWIPCSGVATAIEDAQLAKAIKKHTECRVFQCEEDVVEALDDKLKFMQKTSELGLASLKWLALCDEVDIRDIVDKIRCGNQDLRYMIKSASMDDATRGLLPLLSARDPDKVERILGNLKFSNRQQWLLQEYLPSGEEYCTHALIINGTVRAFTACPSASVLMHYKQLPISSMLYKQMLKFTQEYAAGLGKITGHMSFDFLIRYQDTVDGHIATLAPIECNPRCHTATVLFEGMESELAQVYLEVVHGNKTGGAILHPQSSSEVGYYWMAHDLVVAVSAFFDHFNSDRLSRAVSVKRVLDSIYHGLAWRDPTFQWWDPLPWFVLNHLYWPWVLVKAALNGVRWKQLNVSTTKMFEM
ncbi:hypothetical protein P154DRAFT_446391 [Amniculicola lignicola CBS 123094]|uniref:ATP-grasp domain-containing protein n=1 Tax=Amniculicola lignicola CBS 123094 TaxID=1392246 RepID=A0A6A5W223_9PLEO|nr:hypothetical protein P154DRAFT_446391 [Amniculicola lignicola CBS 123094]